MKVKKSTLIKIAPFAVGVACAAFLGIWFKMITVSGHSMDDTLHDGQTLIARKNVEVTNGDIVVCDCKELGHDLIKRVIATGGQEIDIDFEAHTVTVDGKTLEEPYIKEPTAKNAGAFVYPVTVPDNCYFVMGDNRNDSRDSRDPLVGFISKEQIVGKIINKV